jgi:Rhamnan synthesis protein F
MSASAMLAGWVNGLRHWRRSLKARLPWVRRSRYERLQGEYELLNRSLVAGLPLARDARLVALKPPTADLEGRELCLFVTHATGPELKPHVREHVTQLLDAGVAVALVLNTDLDVTAFRFEPALMARLTACLVRENLGFDFAAWAHAHTICRPCGLPSRLYFVNDSIVGPLSSELFTRMMSWMRSTDADVLGLTENISPRPHLQSFFLVFNRAVLASPPFQSLIDRIVSLPTKGLVIYAYEAWFTDQLRQFGFRCLPMLQPMGRGPHDSNDLSLRWARLVRSGFPYVKMSVLQEQQDDPDMAELVPARFRAGAPS